MGEISGLEKIHKQNCKSMDRIRLNDKYIELQKLLDEQSLQLRDKNRARSYQYGKMLARILKQQAITSIVNIVKTSGEITYDPREISNTFHKYYSNLYNIKTQQINKEGENNNIIEEIRQYIGDTALPILSKEIVEVGSRKGNNRRNTTSHSCTGSG